MLDAINSMVDAINSKTGYVAAIVILLGLFGTLLKLYVDDKDRRSKEADKRAAAERGSQGLEIVELALSDLSLSSNTYELRFLLTNTGTSKLIMRALRLHVTARNEPGRPRESYTQAPINVYRHEVRLGPKEDVYDIRKRHFGRGHEPLSFEPAESSAFVVKLVSDELKLYSFHVEAEWLRATTPGESDKVASTTLNAEFPERISAGPLPSSFAPKAAE